MVKNQKFLKNLLTTASALALVSFSAGSAVAAVSTTNNTPATAQDGVGGLVNFDNVNFTAGIDTLRLGGPHDITTTGALDHVAGPININMNANQTFTVGHAVNYGAQDLEMNLILNVGGIITIQDLLGIGNNVTVNGGTLNMRDAVNDLIVAGGNVAAVRNVGRNVTIANGGTVTQTGTIGGNLNVANTGLYTGTAGASTVTGTTTINTTNAGMNTLHDAAGDVTLYGGNLTMHDTTGVGALGNVTVTAGTLIMNDIRDAGADLLANGGIITIAAVGRDAILRNGADVTQNGAIGQNLDVGGAAIYRGAVGADITGTTTIDTTNAGMNTLHDAAGAVTLTQGNLTMNNAADDVTMVAGTLNMNDVAVGMDLTVAGGNVAAVRNVGRNVTIANGGTVTQTGTIGGNLNVANTGLYTGTAGASTVTGTTTIDTTNAGMNTLHDAAGAVTLTQGNLTMNNAADDVTMVAGTLNMNDVAVGMDLTVAGGNVAAVRNVGRNVTIANGGTVTQTGTIGGNLNVANTGLYTGTAGASTVTGTTTIDTTNAGMNTLHDAAGAVTLTQGNLTMNNAADDVTMVAGTLNMNDVAVGMDLTVAGGNVAAVRNVGRNVTIANGGTVTQTGTIGGNLNVANTGLYTGTAGASTVTGTTTIDTTNAGMNTLHDAAGAVTLTQGNLTMNNAADDVTMVAGTLNMNDVAVGMDLTVAGGNVAAVRNVGRNVTIANGGTVTQTGTIGGNLNVANTGLYTGTAGASTVTGTTTIDTTNAGMNTLHDAAGAVTLTQGNLTMNNAADDVTMVAGTLNMNDVAVGMDLTVAGGNVAAVRNVGRNVTIANGGTVTQTGTIGGNLNVANTGLYTGTAGASTVTGTTTINTTNAGMNTLHDAAGAVTLYGGNLTMHDTTGVGALGNVTVTAGTLIMNDIRDAGADLLANGGIITIAAVGRDAILRNGADVTQNGAIGQNLDVGGAAIYRGAVGADVGGVITINTTNPGINTLHDAAGDVTLYGGNLTMNNAATDVALGIGAGNLRVGNIVRDFFVNGGVVNALGTVGRNVTVANAGEVQAAAAGAITGALDVTGAGLFSGGGATDVGGVITINTTNPGINTLNDAKGAVTLTAGNLTIHDTTGVGALGNVTVTAGTLIMNDIRDAGADLLANGGIITIAAVGRDAILRNGADVTQNGAIGQNLDVGGAAIYRGAVGADITGTTTIDTTNAGMNTLHDAAGAVTLTQGNLTMNNAADDVTMVAGTLNMNDVAVGMDLTVAGGNVAAVRNVGRNVTIANGGTVTQTGTIGGNLNVANTGLYTGTAGASTVTGTTTIDTTNAGMNTLHDAAGDVTLYGGNLTMHDTTGVGALGNVTVTAGTLIMNDIRDAGADLLANGGIITIAAVGRDAILRNGADVTQNGAIGQNLDVGGAAIYRGAVGADVGGVITINTTNPGINTLHDAAGDVTLYGGNLTMNNAATDVALGIGAGNLRVGNIVRDFFVNGGVVNALGTVGRNVTVANAGEVQAAAAGAITGALDVTGAGLFSGGGATDVGGVITINTTNPGINTLNDAKGAVTLTAGNLTIHDTTGVGALGNVTVTAGTLIMNDIRDAGADLLANGGIITIAAVGRDAILRNGADVTQNGAIGQNLDVGGAAIYRGAVGADITGTTTIDTTNAGMNTLHDAAGAVTLTQGNLTMNNAADDVTMVAGTLNMNDVAVGMDLTVAGGNVAAVRNVGRNVTIANGGTVTQTGTIGGNLNVANTGLYTGTAGASTVTGTTTINTTNAGMNTLHDAAGDVTLYGGNLTMHDTTGVGALGNVTVTAGTLIMNDIRDAGADLLANGGIITIAAVGRDAILRNGADVTQNGAIGQNLDVGGAAIYRGAVGADITGTTTIDTTNAGMNTLHDAAGAVTLTQGNLTMNNAADDVTMVAGTLNMNDVAVGMDLTVAGGNVAAVRNVGRNVTIANGGTVTQTGTIGGNLNVANTGLYTGTAGASTVTGTTTIDTTNAGMNTLHDAAGDVTLYGGNLTMHDTTGVGALGNVTVTAGTLIMNDIRDAGADLLANGGIITIAAVGRDAILRNGADVTQNGAIGQNLDVGGAAIYRGAVGADITGTTTIDTTNAGMNTLHDAAGAVTLTQGNLTMNNAADDVTMVAGTLNMNDVAVGMDLTVAGGNVAAVRNVGRNVTIANGGTVTQTGTIGGNLNVANTGLYTGTAGASTVTGTTTIDTTNAGMNTLHDAAGDVTLYGGNLTMHDTTGVGALGNVTVTAGTLIMNDIRDAGADLLANGGIITIAAVGRDAILRNGADVTQNGAIGQNLDVGGAAIYRGAVGADITGTTTIDTTNAGMNTLHDAAGAVTLTQGNLTMNNAADDVTMVAGTLNMNDVAVGMDLTVAGGNVAAVRNVGRNVTIANGGTVTQTGTIGGNLNVANTGLYTGTAGASTVTGTTTIDTTNAGMNTLHDAAGDVTLYGGNLTMHDTTGVGALGNVTVTAGTLIMNDIRDAGADLLANGGIITIAAVGRDAILRNGADVTQNGAIGQNLDVGGAAIYRGAVGADITGTTTIDTTNAGMNTLHDAAGAVTLTQGNLTMNNAADDVTMVAGTLNMNDVAVGMDLTVAGGNVAAVRNVGRNVTIANGGTVTQTGTIGGNLNVANTGLYTGTAGASTVTGTTTIDTTNAGMNTLHDAAGDVTLYGGNLTMHDTTGVGALGNVTVTAGTLIMNDIRDAGADLLANGGIITIAAVGRDAILRNGADVTQNGAIGQNLDVGGAAIYRGAVGADITGTTTIDTTNAGMNTLHDAAGAVTLTQGNLTMNNAADDVTMVAGTLNMNDVAVGMDLTVAGGNVAAVRNVGRNVTIANGGTVTQTGTIGGNLNVANTGLYTGTAGASTVTGTTTIDTTNAGMNTLHDAAGDVTLYGGNLTMHDTTGVGALGNVTVTAGTLIMNDIRDAGADLLANGGIITIAAVGRDAILRNGADVTQNGAIGQNLDVGGAAIYRGAVGADITGTTTIDTTNAGMNTLHDAAGAVTLTQGNLTMNNAADDVTMVAGTLNMNDVAVGMDLTVAGGNVAAVRNVGRNVTIANGGTVTQTGTIGGNLNVANTGLYTGTAGASTVTGTTTIDTTNAGMNTLHDAAGDVTLYGGNLTMHDTTGVGALGNVTVTAGTLIMNDIRDAGADLLANGGIITIAAVGRDAILRNGADVTQNGAIGQNLDVGGAAIYRGAVGADITGTTTIDTTNAGMNTLHDAAGAVTLTQGNLTMNNAADDVTMVAGTLNMNDVAVGMDLTVAGGNVAAVRNVGRNVTIANGGTVTQTGTIGGNLNVANTGLYTGTAGASTVTGTTTINTTNAGMNTLHDAAGDVTLYGGNLTMHDTTGVGALGNVTVTAGTLIMNDIRDAGADLLANGGIITIAAVGRDAILRNGADVTQNGAIGQNLDVGGAAIYRGAVGADVGGVITINTTNPGINTLHDAAGDVTLYGGNLTMNNAATDVALGIGAGNLRVGNIVRDFFVNGGVVNALGTVGRNVTVANAGEVQAAAAGAITGTLDVTGAGLFSGGGATDVGGAITIDTTNPGINTLHDAAGDVTLYGGNLTMNNAATDVALGIGAGNLRVGNIVRDFFVNGGVVNALGTVGRNVTVANAGEVQAAAAGAITGTLDVTGAGLFSGGGATDVGGVITINTTNPGMNTFHDAAGDVTLYGGNLTMHDTTGVGALGNVTVTAGTLIMNDVANDLSNNTGNVTVHNVTGDTNLNGAGTTKITGAATGLLTVQAGHTTEVTGDLTGGVTFTTDEVITLKGAGNHGIGVVTVTPVAAGGAGTFIADEMTTAANTLTFTGNVGTAANPLKLIQAKGGNNVALQGDSYVAKIDIGNSDATLTLGGNIKIVDFAHADDKARLEITNNLTLKSGSVLSTITNKLRDLYFNGNQTLTIEDGVDLYALAGFSNNGVSNGSIVTKGNSTISGKVGAHYTFGGITINSTNTTKTLTFLDELNLANTADITISDTDTIVFNNNVTARSIIGGAPGNKGTAEFTNAQAATITLVNAGANPLAALKVSGGDLNFTGAVPLAATYEFKDQAVTVTANVAGNLDLSAQDFTTTSTTRNQNFKLVNGDLTIGAAGAAGKHFGTFTVDAKKTINVNAGPLFASIGGTDANANFAVIAGGTVDNIGAKGAVMNTVTFTENTEVFRDAYAKKITIADTKTGTFNGIVSDGAVELTSDAIATFKDGSSLASRLAGTADSKGVVNFEGSSSVKNGLGINALKLAAINFTDNTGTKTQTLAGDFYGEKSTFLKTTVQPTGKLTFHGIIDATNTTLDLGTEGITLTDGVAGAPTALKGDMIVKTTFNGTTNGTITVSGATTEADFTGLNSLNIVLKDNSLARARNGNVIPVVTLTNGGTLANLTGYQGVNATGTIDTTGNKFVKWVFDANSLTFASTDIADQAAKEIIINNNGTAQSQENVSAIFDAVSGDAEGYANELIVVGNISEKSFTESVERFSNPATIAASPAVSQIVAQTGNIVTGRIQTLAAPAALRVTQSNGVSAGAEDTLRYGAWGSPFYSHSNQKKNKGSSGYKSKTTGGTVGFDTMANDTMIVGVAATIAKTDLKHRDINSGDKTKADTLMFSIYGLQQINEDWFLQGVANFGSTKVKNTSKRIGAANGAADTQTATAKYDSMIWGGEVLAGYSLKSFTDVAALTPMIGLDYTRVNDGGYTETGTKNQNQIVSKKATDRLQLVAGIRAVASTIEQSGFVITPEAHAFVRQAINNSKAKLSVRLDGLADPIAVHDVKPIKTVSNLGLGINASSGTMSYGLTYDAHLAKKYVGHQGTFKVRVNF